MVCYDFHGRESQKKEYIENLNIREKINQIYNL